MLVKNIMRIKLTLNLGTSHLWCNWTFEENHHHLSNSHHSSTCLWYNLESEEVHIFHKTKEILKDILAVFLAKL